MRPTLLVLAMLASVTIAAPAPASAEHQIRGCECKIDVSHNYPLTAVVTIPGWLLMVEQGICFNGVACL
jgi:hypothetical protein